MSETGAPRPCKYPSKYILLLLIPPIVCARARLWNHQWPLGHQQQERSVHASIVCTRMTSFLHIPTSHTYSYVHQYACLVPATHILYIPILHTYTYVNSSSAVSCKHPLYTDDLFPTQSNFTHILICTSICMLGACYTFLIHPDLTLIYTRVNSRSAVSLQAPSEQGRPVSNTFRLLTHTRT